MVSVVKKYTDYLDVIDESIDNFSSLKKTKNELVERYKDTPVEDIPEEALVVLFSDTPVDSIPEQIRPRVVNAAVALEAKRRGPRTEEEKTQYNVEAAGRGGMPSIPITSPSRAMQIGAEEGLTDSFRTIFGSKKDLGEEFKNRVEVAREGALTDYIGGLAMGGVLDPVTGAAMSPAIKVGSMLGKYSPVLGALAGGAGSGATAGALIPTYDEFGDSRTRNTLFGTALGTATAAVPTAIVKGAQAFSRPPVPPVVPPKLAPQPVPMTLSGGRVQPKETPVTTATVNIEPQVTQSAPSTLKIQNIDNQIATLTTKAATTGRKKRKPIESQIKRLEKAKADEINKTNKAAKEVKDSVIEIENQIARLAQRSQELQPGQAGAKARIQRAERRILELDNEVDILTGLDYAPNGGYQVTVNSSLYANPKQIVAIKNRVANNNTTGSTVEVKLPPPKPTGDPVTDAANEINYAQINGVRLGLDAPPSASSAGVRPAVQYADELSEGVDAAQALSAGTIAPSTARKRAEDPLGADAGREPFMTQEEKGRRATVTAATAGRRERMRAENVGGFTEEDTQFALDNLPSVKEFSYANLEESARLLKTEGFIAREYDTLLDMLMAEENKGKILSPEVMEALRPLFIEAEQRVDTVLKQINKLKREGLADSAEMVELIQDLYLNTYVADLRRANGTAASHILTQAKKTKQFTAANTRRVDSGKLITNLFGVECG